MPLPYPATSMRSLRIMDYLKREIQIGASATRQVRFEVKRFSSGSSVRGGSSGNCCCNGNGSDSWWQCGVVVVVVAAVVMSIETNQLNQRIGS